MRPCVLYVWAAALVAQPVSFNSPRMFAALARKQAFGGHLHPAHDRQFLIRYGLTPAGGRTSPSFKTMESCASPRRKNSASS